MKRLLFIFILLLGTRPIHTDCSMENTTLEISTEKLRSVTDDILSAIKESPDSFVSPTIVSYWKKYRKVITSSLAIITTALIMGYISVHVYRTYLLEKIELLHETAANINALNTYISSTDGQKTIQSLQQLSALQDKINNMINILETKSEGLANAVAKIPTDAFFNALSPL